MPKPTLLLIIFLLAACNSSKTGQLNSTENFSEFKRNLTEMSIGKTKLFIYLPKTYLLQPAVGEDFSVYYFAPRDTSDNIDFSGGIYFGDYPSEFKKDNDSCIIEDVESKILDKDVSWKLYNYNKKCFVQVITDWKEGNDLVKIHAFGKAANKSELEKVLYVFSTLKQK